MTSLISICFILLAALLAAKPMGLYIAKVFDGAPSKIDRFFLPAERLLLELGGVKVGCQQCGKQDKTDGYERRHFNTPNLCTIKISQDSIKHKSNRQTWRLLPLPIAPWQSLLSHL